MKQNSALIFFSCCFCLGIFVRFLVVPAMSPRVIPREIVAEKPRNPFAGLVLSAKAAYVYDATTDEVIFAYNENARLPLASLAKVMTVITAAEVLPRDTILKISSDAGSELVSGDRWALDRLADVTLVGSLNGGAMTFSEVAGARLALGTKGAGISMASKRKLFIEAMNKKALEMGLKETYFLNESGLDESRETAGGYGSARDIAHLFAYGAEHHPDLFAATRYGSVTAYSLQSRKLTVFNTNEAIAALPGALLSKTGTTLLAGGNLGVVFDVGIDHPVVAVILGDTSEGRFADMSELVRRTRVYFSTRHYE